MQDPRFLTFLQPPTVSQQVEQPVQIPDPVEVQKKGKYAADSMEMPRQLAESIEPPRLLPHVQEQASQALPVQSATLQQPNVVSNGQGSSFQAMQQVFPPTYVHLGYFRGGSIFQSMVGYAPRNQIYTPGTVFGGAQSWMPNPMYGNIGMQSGFQGVQGSFGMPQGTLGTAGYQKQQVGIMSTSPIFSGLTTPMPPISIPML